MELQGKTLHILGDSITEGSGASCRENTYVAVLERTFGFKKVNNYGIGGTRIARQATPSENPRFDLDFLMRAEQMTDDADMIFVFGGTNDYGHGDAPLGDFSDRTPDTFYGALHCLYQYLLNKYPTLPIAVATPTHRLNETVVPEGKEYALKRYVEAIREVAQYYGLPVLDFFANSGIQPNLPIMQQTFMPDGLHPNDAGHARLADMVGKFLKQL